MVNETLIGLYQREAEQYLDAYETTPEQAHLLNVAGLKIKRLTDYCGIDATDLRTRYEALMTR